MITNQKIAIIDYGIGNVHSVTNAISYLGYKNLSITSNQKIISNADVFILPGVGAFDEAMSNLRNRNLEDVLSEQVLVKKKPILGICVGMQMLASFSEENGIHRGLDWIKGSVIKLDSHLNFAVPHVGWNDVVIKKNHPYLIII